MENVLESKRDGVPGRVVVNGDCSRENLPGSVQQVNCRSVESHRERHGVQEHTGIQIRWRRMRARPAVEARAGGRLGGVVGAVICI